MSLFEFVLKRHRLKCPLAIAAWEDFVKILNGEEIEKIKTISDFREKHKEFIDHWKSFKNKK